MKLMVKVLERSQLERQPWSPAFGPPVDRVAGVTDPSYPAISRIFVPLLLERWGDFDGWRNACHTLGVDLRADTLWSELSEASDIRQVSIGERQQGTFN